ncbi:MAG: Holliday junction branch migration protein RuvA [bacterium]
MIAHLQGVVTEKMPTRIVLDVQGVGYDLLVPISTYEKVGEIGSPVRLLTYLQVREDLMQLFGFFSENERTMFQHLISVSGIGPKLAVGILSGCSVDELQKYIVNDEVPMLTKLSGVGKKTAQRMVMELKEKLGDVARATDWTSSVIADEQTKDKISEAVLALISLGFNKSQAQNVLLPIIKADNSLPLDEIIKKALQVK